MGLVSKAGVSTSLAAGVVTAIVTWATDMAGDSTVAYGTGAIAGTNQLGVVRDANLVTAHSQTVPGLAPGTLCWVQISSGDAFGTPFGYDPSIPNGVVTFSTPADSQPGPATGATLVGPTAPVQAGSVVPLKITVRAGAMAGSGKTVNFALSNLHGGGPANGSLAPSQATTGMDGAASTAYTPRHGGRVRITATCETVSATADIQIHGGGDDGGDGGNGQHGGGDDQGNDDQGHGQG